MVIGFGTITFRLDQCHGLKEKRKIIKSIISRSKNGFNAAIAEVDFNDMHQRAKIGFALVGNDRRMVNSQIDKLHEFIYRTALAEIIETETEILNI
ncbi:MAG: DUF503 domain-containing protein [Desulfobacteraceae bacterium]|nr:DUF503 domain-containing protein [Desulfobacteraceae bacterium]MCF8095421.1 DUF503 domain-containing protein [Desulfobacteraceae bacterium]